MHDLEKFIPSIKPVNDEIRRKSSVRRVTSVKLVEFRIKLQKWCNALMYQCAEELEQGEPWDYDKRDKGT